MRAIIGFSAFAVALSPMAAFADVTVGRGVDVSVDVPTGNAVAIEGNVRAADGAGSLDKTGGGSLTLPAGGVWTRDRLDVNVREGTLSITDSGSVPALNPDAPPAALDKAAFWLEAGTNTAVWSKDESRIAAWYDVREAKADGEWGDSYYRVESRPAKDSNNVVDGITNFPQVATVAVASGSRPMMYFNGVQSGSNMRYVAPDGTDSSVSGVCHAFVALKIQDAYGYVFGGTRNVFLHPGYNNTVANGAYALPRSSSAAFANGRFFLDGRLADSGETVRKKLQIIEVECGDIGGTIDAIFNDRGMKGRYGGDYVGELVLFTNRLTEAERFDVSEYLVRKWVDEPDLPAVTVNAAEGAEVELSGSGVPVTGLGLLWLNGGDFWRNDAEYPFSGRMRFSGDSAACTLGLNDLPYAVRPGDTITATKDSFDVVTATSSSDSADALAGVARSSGSVPLRVESLSGVKEFNAGSAKLTLSAPRRTENTAFPEVYATIAGGNADFERQTEAGVYCIYSSVGATETRGWVLEPRTTEKPNGTGPVSGTVYLINAKTALDRAPLGDSWLFGFNYADHLTKFDIGDFYPSDNGTVAIIKTAGSISAEVDVPETGDYELSFDMETRIYYDTGRVEVSLVDETGDVPVTNTIARFLQPNYKSWPRSAKGWVPYRFKVCNVAKGTHRLLVVSEGARPDADCCAILDNFELKLVTDPQDRAIRAMPPNWSFEVTDCPYDLCTTYSPGNTVQDWELIQSSAETPPAAIDCEACFSARWHKTTDATAGYWFCGNSPYGESQLLLREAGGYARSAPFRLSAGTWRLHFRGTRWAFDGDSFKCKGLVVSSLAPSLAASVIVDGEEVSLGKSATFPLNRYEMQEYSLPDTFTVDKDDSLVLCLRQGTESSASSGAAAAAIDDVWFERVDCVLQGVNLVDNGSFEDGSSSWTFQDNKIGLNDKSAARDRASGDSAMYGYTLGDGLRSLLLTQIGQATQRISFPEAGLYRLCFWTRSRYTTAADTGAIATYFGGNQVRAWLADDNGVTQEIYRTESVYSTNFFEHVAMFDMKTPGTYTLGLQGCNDYPDHVTTRSGETGQKDSNVFVDAVSVRKVSDSDMPELDEELQLNLSETSKLCLDFAGTATIKGLRVGGHKVSGLIEASHPSGLVSGPGCLYIRPEGTVILFR